MASRVSLRSFLIMLLVGLSVSVSWKMSAIGGLEDSVALQACVVVVVFMSVDSSFARVSQFK